MTPADEVKLYFDYKSPFTYLAKDPAFALERALEIGQPDAVAAVIDELGHSGRAYRAWRSDEGARAFAACEEEAAADHAFGVPLFVFRGEPFWGYDRMPLLEDRLTEAGLGR